jgi:hypothetical protein
LTGFLARAFLEKGFYSLSTVRIAFLAFKTIAFGFFKGALRAKRLAV